MAKGDGMDIILKTLTDSAVTLRNAQEKQRLADIEYKQAKDAFDQAVKDCGIQ